MDRYSAEMHVGSIDAGSLQATCHSPVLVQYLLARDGRAFEHGVHQERAPVYMHAHMRTYTHAHKHTCMPDLRACPKRAVIPPLGLQSLSASLQEAQGRLTSALAASEALQQQKRELVAQLYGSEDTPSISSAAAGCLPNHPASPSLDGRVPLAGEGLFQRVQRLAAALARSEAAAAEAGLALEYARQEVAEVRAAQRAAVDKAAALEREVGLLRQRTEAAESDARAAISRADDAAATADRRAAEMTAGTAQIDQLRARITGLESECATALAQASAYAAEHEQADAAVAALRAQLSQLQKANAALQEKVNRGTAQLAAARVKMEVRACCNGLELGLVYVLG